MAGTQVTFAGSNVTAKTPEGAEKTIPIEQLFNHLYANRVTTSELVLPDGVKAIIPGGNQCVVVHQTPPRIHNLKWISEDSPSQYGPGTKYRTVRIALPYIIVLAHFGTDGRGNMQLGGSNECFFANSPLKSLDDEVFYPALLNCSKYPNPETAPAMSWICTQYLNFGALNEFKDFNKRVRESIRSLYDCLFNSGFNKSSEAHEGNSWFSETVANNIDPRLSSVKAWEKATAEAKDHLWVLDVPWLKTGKSVRQIADRIFTKQGAVTATVKKADDIARVIINNSR